MPFGGPVDDDEKAAPDQFGLCALAAALTRPVKPTDVKHLCPTIPHNAVQHDVGDGDDRAIKLFAEASVKNILCAVSLDSLVKVQWWLINSILSCARHFLQSTAADQATQWGVNPNNRPWMTVGPSEVADKRYAYDLGGATAYSVSLMSMACKEKKVIGNQRALTLAALYTLSLFWLFALLERHMGHPALFQSALAFDMSQKGTPETAPAGTFGGSSAIFPGDGTPARSDGESAAGSPPEVGHVTARKDLGMCTFPPWRLYDDCWTSTRYARVGSSMKRVYERLPDKFARRIGFPAGLKTNLFAFLDEGDIPHGMPASCVDPFVLRDQVLIVIFGDMCQDSCKNEFQDNQVFAGRARDLEFAHIQSPGILPLGH